MVNRAVLTKVSTQYKGNTSSVTKALLQFSAVLVLSQSRPCLSVSSSSYTKYGCILSQTIKITIFPQ